MYVSQVQRRSQRRRTAPGRGQDVGRVRARRGENHPAACGRHPTTEGIRTWVWTKVAWSYPPPKGATCVQVPIPSVEGCRRSGGVVSPAGRVPRPNPRL
ncbi:MAG: hypothetical protein LBM98_06420 [Oscillospiraceae bacterium]|nr:hypothetical protein [Oscillospiraceae bacterium]